MRFTSVRILGLAVGVAVGTVAANAHASMLVDESFTHPNGNLVGQTPDVGGTWAAHSGGGSVPVQVTSGTAVVAQGSGSREDVNVPFAGGEALGPGEKFYAAFDLTMADPGTAVTTSYFAHFLESTTLFSVRTFVSAGSSGGYRVGISNTGTVPDTTWASDLAFGTTYRVVLSYDYDTADGNLWVDPVNESSTSIATTTDVTNEVTAFAFRQTSGNTSQVIDNLNVATTFDEANTGVGVPEPASLGVLALGGLALLARRRK